jgi:molybdopterin molybdotransferase
VVDESRAGRPATHAVSAGAAIAISTGATLPAGADAVVPVEQARAGDGQVEVLAAAALGAHVRRAGDDIRAGTHVLGHGVLLGPAQLGVLASLGRAHVECVARPRVAVITTGDELVAPGEPLRDGAIYDSNSFTVAALARHAGGDVVVVQRVVDDRAATAAALAQALEVADVVVICGGVSVGAHDHVKPSLAALGVQERFWRIALKPGKPTWFGTRGGRLVFGLPGNPVSSMVTFTLLVAPALAALGGALHARERVSATLEGEIAATAGRAHAVRCVLTLAEDGWRARPTGDQSSHVLTSMVGADALAIVAADRGVVAGERVEVELL